MYLEAMAQLAEGVLEGTGRSRFLVVFSEQKTASKRPATYDRQLQGELCQQIYEESDRPSPPSRQFGFLPWFNGA